MNNPFQGIYEAYKSGILKVSPEVVTEKKDNQDLPKHNDKKGSKNTELVKDTGPEAADNFKKDLIDCKKKKENKYSPEKFSLKNEKTQTRNLNNGMSKKSLFDKLFEDVMNDPTGGADDAADLGIDTDVGSDMGGEGLEDELAEDQGESVTLTLPKHIAEILHDELGKLLAGGEEDLGDDLGDDFGGDDDFSGGEPGGEDFGTMEDEGKFGEAVDSEEVSDEKAKKLTKKGLAPGTVKATTGKAANTKPTDKVGNDGELKYKEKGQKVESSKTGETSGKKGLFD